MLEKHRVERHTLPEGAGTARDRDLPQAPMLEGGEQPAFVREQLDAVGFADAVLLEQDVAAPLEPAHLLGERRLVLGIGDGVAVDAAAVSHDPGKAWLDDNGPAKRGRRPEGLSDRGHELRSRHGNAELSGELGRRHLVVAHRQRSRFGQRKHADAREPIACRRQGQHRFVGDGDDQVDPAFPGGREESLHHLLRGLLGRRVAQALGRVAGVEAGAARVRVRRDHVHPASAQRADDGDGAAPTGVGDEDCRLPRVKPLRGARARFPPRLFAVRKRLDEPGDLSDDVVQRPVGVDHREVAHHPAKVEILAPPAGKRLERAFALPLEKGLGRSIEVDHEVRPRVQAGQ